MGDLNKEVDKNPDPTSKSRKENMFKKQDPEYQAKYKSRVKSIEKVIWCSKSQRKIIIKKIEECFATVDCGWKVVGFQWIRIILKNMYGLYFVKNAKLYLDD